MKYGNFRSIGFTIIELLVAIVVISVLATIIVVTFTGIGQKALAASLKSDLINASTDLKLFKLDHGHFPVNNRCPISNADEICLKSSSNNLMEYTPAGGSSPQSFTLDCRNGTTKYRITNLSTVPTLFVETPITAIANISGTPRIDSVLTAGSLTPAGATATYQWQRSDSVNGVYTAIPGATANTYTIVLADVGKYIKVVSTGTGNYSGSVTSAATSVVTAGSSVETVNGNGFHNMVPWDQGYEGVWWGSDWTDEWDENSAVGWGCETDFDLSAYSTGTITNASLTWTSSNGFGDGGGRNKYLMRGDNNAVLQTWDTSTQANSSSAAGIATFLNARKGMTATFLWRADDGVVTGIWWIQQNMANPVLTFTYTP